MRLFQHPSKAVILVGGQGTRLQPLTYYVPKPMVPVLNRPFLEHTIAYLKRYGVSEVILALSYLPEVIQEHFEGKNPDIRMAYTIEVDPLGTAGAVKNAEQYLDGTFVVLNGDIFTEIDIADMVAFHRQRGARATIALTWVDNPSAFGVVETDRDSRVKRFIEKPAPGTATTNWINAGIYVLEPGVLKHVPPGRHYMFERGLFPLLLDMDEPIYGYPFKGYWIDMGTVGKYLRLNCDLLAGVARSPLINKFSPDGVFSGEGVEIASSAVVAGPAIIGDGCRIGEQASLRGPLAMGADCRVGKGALIQGSVVWDRVRIGDGARLEQCVVSTGCRIKGEGQILKQVVTPDHLQVLNEL